MRSAAMLPNLTPLVRVTTILAAIGFLASAPPLATQQLLLDSIRFPDSLRNEVAQVAPVYRANPRDASVLYQVAALHARAGHTEAALAALTRLAELSTGVDPRVRDGFASLERHPDFIALRARIQRENPPVHHARLAFDIPTSGVGPEGIAWSATTRLIYLSGFGNIRTVDSTGNLRPFANYPAAKIGGVLGMRVDDRRGELWATSTGFGSPPADAVIGLFRFRLKDGSLIASYPMADSAVGFLNDIAIGVDGTAYATATSSGALVRVDPGSGLIDLFLPAGTLPDPNGIAASDDGRYLFVAGWYGIVRVDLRTRATTVLKHKSNIASGCLDGLYLTGPRTIVGVQNCVHATGRVMRFTLSAERDSIETAEVLESYNPLFEGVTTAAVAGPALYFIANVQFRKLGPDGKPISPFDPLHMLRLCLCSNC